MKNKMGRFVKSLGLIGMLVACLALTGCVVPPDDIGTSGDYVVTDNDLPFQSMGPVNKGPTATPYNPPTATPTATPTRTPYTPPMGNNTGVTNPGSLNVGAPTNPPSGVISVIPQTGITTNAPASSTSTLKNGSTGSDVRKLQERLKELGYLKGSADGDFGDATETAVKNFQAQNGLSVDGVAGANTLAKVYSASAKRAPTTTVTNTPRPTNTPFTSYKNGDTGAEVRKLQQRLKQLGYLKGNVDGDFGDATEAAVKAFQRNNGLTADGKAGSMTLDKLYSSSAKSAATATPTAKPTNTPFTSYKNGDSGDEIRQMQQRLRELGYLKSWADGDFGDETEAAIRAFQARHGLTQDGKAGLQTLNKLYSDSAKYAVATATPTAKPTKTPAPTATPKADNLTYYLRSGSTGAKVRVLQNRLIELGWLEGTADGVYGNATEFAVKAFQARYASLWTDGIAGPDTLKIMYGAGAATSKTPAASLGLTLEMGDQGDAVKALQKRLRELGYLKSTADGDFGSETQAALIAFQTANKLTVDGKANKATLNALYSNDAKDADAFKDEEDAKKEEDVQDPEDATDIEVGGYTTLREGDQGEAVKKLQRALKNRGYYSNYIDGDYAKETIAAVKAFQEHNGLKADGVAGPATQSLLYGTAADDADTTTSLKKGAYGTAVRNLQYVLYELGYYDGPIDGDYGDTTEDAVRAFQINNDLTPVDGIAGTNTLKVLYSGKAIGASAPSASYTPLSKGDKGTLVVEMQELLSELGYLSEVTGEYDSATVEAVKNFQRRNDLYVDGKAGQETQAVLYGKDPTPAW